MVPKTQKSNKSTQRSSSPALKRVRKNVYRQALLAGLVIVLTVVILFAITAAWYTNIVESNGLVFEAAQWGFDGTVTLGDAPILAGPGDEGVIELTARSDSDLVTEVSVNVSKLAMSPLMQERIYFYVDAQKTRNGEIMDRVYLSSTGSYTYTMFSKGTLTLTESVYNDAQLKWQWVYDVLGYYVLGTWSDPTVTTDPETGVTVSTGGTMAIDEYLRPIEYDYDAATTVFAPDGTLESVNGQSVAEFLLELSAKDGYPGQIIGEPNAGGYYPVEVDANGYGVWAYLCTYGEIVENNREDNDLGESAAEEQYKATVTIAAQNSDMRASEVRTSVSLLEAINAAKTSGSTAVIRLVDDVTLNAPLVLDGMEQVMLDLNGYVLELPMGTYEDMQAGIQALPGSSLTVLNGDIASAEDGKGVAVYASGAEITMSNVTIANVECALYVRDEQNDAAADSKIRIVDSVIDVGEEGVYLSGNGSSSAQKTQLVVENTTIDSGYIGIMGNGNTSDGGQWGTDVQIIGSQVGGYYAGVYQPQKNSTMTVSGGSTITGNTGIALKGGTVNIESGTIRGTGELVEPDGMPGSGFSDTGDAIYIETNYGYEIVLEISGADTLIASDHALALRVYDANATTVAVDIYSGTFSSDVSGYLADGSTISFDGSNYIVAASVAVLDDVTDPATQDTEHSDPSDRTSSDAEGGDVVVTPGEEEPFAGDVNEPGTEEPGTEEPGTEEPGTEEPGTEEPGTEEPGTEEPGTEEPGTEEPGTEEPGTDEPGTDEPVTEEPVTEEPGTDGNNNE